MSDHVYNFRNFFSPFSDEIAITWENNYIYLSKSVAIQLIVEHAQYISLEK